MPRTRFVLATVLLLLAIPLFAKSHVPMKNTHSAVKAYVEQAAKLVAQNGPDCAALQTPAWRSGDSYIFVAAGGKTLCHADPKIVGVPLDKIIDANGKNIGVALAAAAEKNGGGWVEYVWPRPGTTTPVAKSSYAINVKGPDGKTYLVGAGGYELQ